MNYSNLRVLNSTPFSSQSFENSSSNYQNQNQFYQSNDQSFTQAYYPSISVAQQPQQPFYPITNLPVDPAAYFGNLSNANSNNIYSTRPNYFPSSSPQKNWGSPNASVSGQDQSFSPPTSPTSSSNSSTPSEYVTSNVYIRLLPPHATEESLYSLCSTYGPIISVRTLYDEILPLSVYDELGIMIPPQTKKGEPKGRCCTGIGFVLFSNLEGAERCVKGMNERGFQARFAKESITHKIRRLGDSQTTNLYLSNLPSHYNEQSLIKLFSASEVKCVRLLRETDSYLTVGQRETGPNRGIGFARLIDRSAAELAIERLNGTWLEGSKAPLRIRYADSVEQKEFKAQVSSQQLRIRARLDFKNLASHTCDSSNNNDSKKFETASISSTCTPNNSPFTSPSHSQSRSRNRSGSLTSISNFSMITNSTTPNNSPTKPKPQEVVKEGKERIRKELELKFGVPPSLTLIPLV